MIESMIEPMIKPLIKPYGQADDRAYDYIYPAKALFGGTARTACLCYS